MTPSFTPVAERGVLVGLADAAGPEALALICALDQALATAAVPGVTEVTPGLVNLMIQFDPLVTDHDRVIGAVQALFPLAEGAGAAPRVHDIPVCYDAALTPDLSAVAKARGMTEDAVAAAHLAGTYSVDMYGFAPGFAYLTGVPEAIRVPRKPAAVRDIPAGSVMIAASQSIVTTLKMPTGWSIIGRSPAQIMRDDTDRPFLFDIGDRVRFVRISRADLPAGMQTP